MTTIIRKRDSWIERQLEMNEYIGKRKHSSQLQQDEIDIIWERLNGVKDWSIARHALDRLQEKGIEATYADIISTIQNASIIEYKIDYNKRINRCEDRVVLRANAVVNGCYNLNAVYSLENKTIVTVWINHVNDLHDTLKWEIYSEDLKVFGAK